MSVVEQIKNLKELLDKGAITHSEFEALKEEILTGIAGSSSNSNHKSKRVLLVIMIFLGLSTCIYLVYFFLLRSDTGFKNKDQSPKPIENLESITIKSDTSEKEIARIVESPTIPSSSDAIKIVYPEAELNPNTGEAQTPVGVKKVIKLICPYNSNNIYKLRIVFFSYQNSEENLTCHMCGPDIDIADVTLQDGKWQLRELIEKFDEINNFNFRSYGEAPTLTNTSYMNSNSIAFEYPWLDKPKTIYFAVNDLRKL